MTYTFKVSKREDKVNDDALCMGVVYGPKTESLSLKFNKKDFWKLYDEAGQSSIIVLEGLEKPIEVVVQEIFRAPITNDIHHVSFYALERGVEMNTEVNLVFVNEAPAVKLGATINQVVHSVSITCKPKDLIHDIEVDLSVLKEIGDTIYAKDLPIPSTITLNMDLEAPIASALAPNKQEKKEEEEIVEAADVPVVNDEGSENQEESEGKS